MPRLSAVCALLILGTALPLASTAATAAGPLPSFKRPADAVIAVGSKDRSRPRDCTPTNGPFGFYGNIWCEPPSEAQYLRNLSAGWPMKTPRALKDPQPQDNSTDW